MTSCDIHGKYSALALWEFQSIHNGVLPDSVAQVEELETIANAMIAAADLNKQVLTTIPRDLAEQVTFTLLSVYLSLKVLSGQYRPLQVMSFLQFARSSAVC